MHHYYSSWSLEQAPTCWYPGYSNISLPRRPALVHPAEYSIISVNIWCAGRALACLAGQVYNAWLLLDSADSLVCSWPEHKVPINSLYEKSPLLLLIYSLGFRPQPWMLKPLTWYIILIYNYQVPFLRLRWRPTCPCQGYWHIGIDNTGQSEVTHNCIKVYHRTTEIGAVLRLVSLFFFSLHSLFRGRIHRSALSVFYSICL